MGLIGITWHQVFSRKLLAHSTVARIRVGGLWKRKKRKKKKIAFNSRVRAAQRTIRDSTDAPDPLFHVNVSEEGCATYPTPDNARGRYNIRELKLAY